MTRPSLIRGQHLPGLDGMRGLAVLCVLFLHLGHRVFQGGYVGVDLFFVLSGFLITSLLIEEQSETSRVALGAFYARRAKRLFPALAASIVLTCVAIVVMGHWRPIVHAGFDFGFVRQSLFAAIFYVENWVHPSLQNPVKHMWSLAVEEQFYILWPLTLMALLLWFPRRAVVITGVLSLAGMSVFTVGSEAWGNVSVYTSSFSRAGQLLAGAVLAFLLQSASVRSWCQKRITFAAPLALVGFLFITQTSLDGELAYYPPKWMFEFGFLLTTVAAMILIATNVVASTSLVARIFQFPLLVKLGLISYGLYVYHWVFIFYVTRESTGLPWLAVDVIRVVGSVLLAIVSYRYFEMPLRRLRYNGLKRLLPALALALVLVASIIATIPSIGAPYGAATPTAPVVPGSIAEPLDIHGSFATSRPAHRVMIIGDVAMKRLALPLVRALSIRRDLVVTDLSATNWGITSSMGVPLTPDEQRSNVNLTALGIQVAKTDLVVLSSTLGDFTTAGQSPDRYERGLARLVTLIVNQPQSPRVLLILGPSITLDGKSSDQLATNRINDAMRRVALRWPGRVVVVGAGAITNLAAVAPVFGPPSNEPEAPHSQWVRWRAPDGVSLCQPAVVRQVSVVLRAMEPIVGGDVNEEYWHGRWTKSTLFTTPSRCLSDHP